LRREFGWTDEEPSLWRVFDDVGNVTWANVMANIACAAMIVFIAGVTCEWRRRRRNSVYQFRLTDLLAVTAFVAIIAARLVNAQSEYREELRLIDELNASGGSPLYIDRGSWTSWEPRGPNWLRHSFGDASLEVFDRVAQVSADEWQLESAMAFRHLKSLRVQPRTKITQQGLTQLSDLKELEALDLSSVLFVKGKTYLAEESIALPPFPKLRGLSVSQTIFAGNGLEHSPSLEVLDLARSNVDDRIVPQLAKMRRLRALSLAETRVTRIPELPKLRFLNLAGATEFGGEGLEDLSMIESLSLRNTQVDNETIPALVNMPELVHLDLSNSKVTDAGLKHVAEAKRLKYLFLNHLPITDQGLIHLQSLKELEELELCFTQISDDGIQHLQKMGSLRRLRLTELSSHAMEVLRRRLPNCDLW
jgi:hypothetical protein